MPFTPLPAIFIADLVRATDLDRVTNPARANHSDVLELGSGDGAFTAVLRDLGANPLTIDRGAAAMGIRAHIRGDALAPPLRGRFAMVIVANLLRHLWRKVGVAGPGSWRDLVAPGGSLWVFEDEPRNRPAAARHYRDLQGLLARLDPLGRGPLLTRRRFETSRRAWSWAGDWKTGEASNEWPVETADVVAWLGGGVTETGGEVDRLASAIRQDGLSYGRYWWARWRAENES